MAMILERDEAWYALWQRTGSALHEAVTAHLRGLLTDDKVAAQLYAFLARDPATP